MPSIRQPELTDTDADSLTGKDTQCDCGSTDDSLRGRKSEKLSFSRRSRLLSPLSFTQVFGTGRQWKTRNLVLYTRRSAEPERRLGVVAGKRTFRRAVERNRAKRLLREAFRLNQHRIATGSELVLIARRNILKARLQDVERDLLNVCRRSGILCGKEG